MRVVLRYTRLPKPRGGWNFGLSIVLRVEYSDAESTAFAPDWKPPEVVWPVKQLTGPERSSKTLHTSYFSAIGTGYRGTVYLATSADRETLIAWLIDRRDEAVLAAQKFWDDNPPVEGERETIMDVDVCDGVVETPSEEPTVRRKVRVMAGVGA